MTRKERIVAMLRALEHHQEALDLENEHYASTHVAFGHVDVYISEKFGGAVLDVGINWSALETVSSKEAWKMTLDLQHAAWLADLVQFIIDGKDDAE